jgi:23S rRNA (pseudouridine1915-N3)-methyltransferase
MLKVRFITIGDLPRGPLLDLRENLVKPLKQFVQLEHVAVKDEAGCEKYLKDDVTIALTEHGREFTSPEFSQYLKEHEDSGRHVTVFLANAFGFRTDFPEKVDLQLSLSKMTFPHDIAHVLFLEQLYRAMTIAHGKTYHY